MACRVVVLLSAVLVLRASYSHSEYIQSVNNNAPRISAKYSTEEIRKLQANFFHLLKENTSLGKAENITATITALNSLEGQKLMRSLADALVPTLGHEDSRELLHNFWKQLKNSVPKKISKKLYQLEMLYEEIDSFPAMIGSIMESGENAPIVQLLSEMVPYVNVSELLRTVTPDPKVLYDTDITTRILHIMRPAVDKFFRDNNIDLQADAVIQIITGLASQFQSSGSGKNKSLSDGTRKKDDSNPLSMLLPILGMIGGQGKKGNQLFDNIFKMLNKNSQGNPMMEGLFSLLGNNMNNGENNMLESVMGMMNGGKVGGDNMLGLMMGLMNGLGNKKKQNDNMNVLATVMGMMSGSGEKQGDMAGMAKLALDLLSPAASKKKTKPNSRNTVGSDQYEEKVNSKKQQRDSISTTKTSENKTPKTRLLTLLEPALLKLHTNTACHPKLEAVMLAGKAMLDNKSMGMKAFLFAAVPVAIAGLPGGPDMLHELTAAVTDMGLRDKDLTEILADIRDEGECVSLGRRAAPHLAKLLLLLSEPDIQDTVTRVIGDQIKAALETVGLKGLTLSNWQQMLGPIINMGAAGMPIEPLPLLAAALDHGALLLNTAKEQLAGIRGSTLQEVIPKVEYEVGYLLHSLGSVEHHLSQQQHRGDACVAQVVCRAAENEQGLRATVLSGYSVTRALLIVPRTVNARLMVLSAAATSGVCKDEFQCSEMEAEDDAASIHARLDYDDTGHQEL